MDQVPSRFPFPTSFQFRDDERSSLEAFFMRAFFDEPCSAEAMAAIARTRFQPAPSGGAAAPGVGALVVPAAHDAAAAPGPALPIQHILLYRGADGIGKTRVFRQFREIARNRSIPVYEVYHHDVEGIPFKPFLHAIREILRDHDRGAALQEKYRHGLESLIPELYAPSRRGDDGSAEDLGVGVRGPQAAVYDEVSKIRIFDAITQLLLEVTARMPVVILVHDLHWGDRPTLELLDYIGRNLQLRHAALRDEGKAPGGSDPLPTSPLADIGAGPELDDFDAEEWRTLNRSAAGAQELLGVPYYAFPPQPPMGAPRAQARSTPARWTEPAEDAAGDLQSRGGAAPAVDPPRSGASGPRLMILGNYRGFVNEAHYLEQALRTLGDQSFAYHGELRPLNRVEADQFLAKCMEGVDVHERAFRLEADAVERIYEACEGFPSFMQELLRALYLREGGFAVAGDAPPVWTGASIAAALVAFEAAPGAVNTDSGVFSLPAAGPGAPLRFDLPDEKQPPSRRHAVLRLRLASASADELRVLQVMATARRPLSPKLLASVIQGLDPLPPDDVCGRVTGAIESLEVRGIIEKHELVETCYFFRLWDYVIVVEEKAPEEEQKRIHQRIGEEYSSRLAGENDEAAFEVYYHLRRGPQPRASLPYGLQAVRRFVRFFALEKARRVQNRMVELLLGPEDLAARLELLEQMAAISLGLRDGLVAEDILRRVQSEGAALHSPERKVELILAEAEAARLTAPAKGLKVLGKTAKHLRDENSVLGVRVQLLTAQLRMESQDFKRAINFALKGANICQKIGDVPELGELYRIMASAFYRKGDYEHAVDNYQRALDAFERLGLKAASVSSLDELGRVYLERGHHFRAARYLYKALEIRRGQHDLAGLCKSYDELGRVYLRSGDYLKTIEILNRSLSLKERIGDFAGLNPTLAILGDLYFRLGRYERSLHYFQREVENSQQLTDTRGLVDGFCQLGRAHFEIGDIRQAEVYAKQVSILATEFKLRSQEADGALLDGALRALNRDWNGAEKSLRLAAEQHGKLGHRRREIAALLDLAEVKLTRELHDEALKIVSRAQLIAEQVKALDLQVRALVIKGNTHRFLKGGNVDKARELLHKALELGQKISDVGPLFQLYYLLARVSHSQREFAEAANYYSKAELILRQTGEALSEDRRARFLEDRRRKVFAEDVARFRKDALGRASGPGADGREQALAAASVQDRPVGFAEYRDLAQRILRVNREMNQLHFHDRVLAEAIELAGAERGFILRVQNRQYYGVAFHGFGKNAAQHPELTAASTIAQEAIKRGRSVLAASGGELAPDRAELQAGNQKQEKELPLRTLSHCSILAVPFLTDDRIFGGVYLDKPIVVGQFLPRSQVLLEAFAQHAAVALANRRELETAVREPLTGFYTPSYFLERLRDAYRWFNLHGKSFTLIGYHVPQLESALEDGRGEVAQSLARELVEMLSHRVALCWGPPVLNVLLGESDVSAQDEVAAKVRARLTQVFGDEPAMEILPAHNRFHQGAEIYFELRRRLLPESADRKALGELGALLEPQVTLREAKLILERHKIETTLRKTGGNITHAARELGIHRPQLSNLLKKHELKRGLFETEGNGEDVEAAAEPADN